MAARMCMQNCTSQTDGTGGFLYEMIEKEIWLPWNSVAGEYITYTPWMFALLGSTMVGLAGVFPLLVISIGDEGANSKNGASAGTLKMLLSFAVGGLLGDVFLHLLPEAWENDVLRKAGDAGHPSMTCGLWVLGGFLVFVIVEKIFVFEDDSESEATSASEDVQTPEIPNHEAAKEMENNNCITMIGGNPKNGFTNRCANTEFSKGVEEVLEPFLERKSGKNGYMEMVNGVKTPLKNGFVKSLLVCDEYPNGTIEDCLKNFAKENGFAELSSTNGYISGNVVAVENRKNSKREATSAEKPKYITGYLNLLANIIDNFTHGLAIGGSFLVSIRLGTLTTFAILIHEIPHEVGDFAILLRSGFNRWDAARAQLFTASGGIFGALVSVFFSGGGVEARTSWILPFTAGGFLHIGMVTILPDLLKESSPKESMKQLGALLLGMVLMMALTILCD